MDGRRGYPDDSDNRWYPSDRGTGGGYGSRGYDESDEFAPPRDGSGSYSGHSRGRRAAPEPTGAPLFTPEEAARFQAAQAVTNQASGSRSSAYSSGSGPIIGVPAGPPAPGLAPPSAPPGPGSSTGYGGSPGSPAGPGSSTGYGGASGSPAGYGDAPGYGDGPGYGGSAGASAYESSGASAYGGGSGATAYGGAAGATATSSAPPYNGTGTKATPAAGTKATPGSSAGFGAHIPAQPGSGGRADLTAQPGSGGRADLTAQHEMVASEVALSPAPVVAPVRPASETVYRARRPAVAIGLSVVAVAFGLLFFRGLMISAFGPTFILPGVLSGALALCALPLLVLGLYGLVTGAAHSAETHGFRLWAKPPLAYLLVGLVLVLGAAVALG